MSRAIAILLLPLLLCLAPQIAQAHGSESDAIREHTVYSGQRLGSIAKRYNVSIDAICHANGIDRREPIRPGQELIIPSRSDKSGEQARQLRLKEQKRASTKSTEPQKSASKQKKRKSARTVAPPRTHTVYRGQRLGSIAKRYNVTIQAICHANGIDRKKAIRPGQKLLIPSRDDVDGSFAREFLIDSSSSKPKRRRQTGSGSWKRYEKPPWRRGYVKLIGHHETWKGYIIGPGNKVLGGARRAVSRVLTAPKNRKLVNTRLVHLLATVSDTFGGRPLRIISGYRTTSYVRGSRHKLGRAVDFRVVGVPNEVLRDYLRTFDKVGVGYYPNSTFVHLDVRRRSAYWIDYAGPGEAPQLRRSNQKQKAQATKSKRPEAAERPDPNRSARNSPN